MEEELKKLDNSELISVYRLILEHMEYLKNESEKVDKEEEKWLMN